MRTIGLIGGIGWRSSADYYRLINEDVARRRGGLQSARIVMTSLNFADVRRLVDSGESEALVDLFTKAARDLEKAGADVLALCSNAAHARITRLQSNVSRPFLHIADGIASRARSAGLRRVALLGTRETMEGCFMRDALSERAHVEVLVPPPEERAWLHEMIFGVLEQGLETDDHRREMQAIIGRLSSAGAEGVILGCTELPLLMRNVETAIPLLDSTELHATALVDFALQAG